MSAQSSMIHRLCRRRKATERRRSFVPGQSRLMTLEPRQLMTTASLSAGILTVTGTGGDDTIAVVQAGSSISAAGKSFALSSVNSIVINGLAGKDTLSVTSALPATLNGGPDANTYPGVPADDIIIDPTLTGGRAMSKAVMDKYQSLGGSAGSLGLPSADEAAAYGGRVVHFQGGEIDYSAATGAHAIQGVTLGELNATVGMTDAYGSWVRPKLGLATTDTMAELGGAITYFQGGEIDASSATGAHVVIGAIDGELNATVKMTDAYGSAVRPKLGLATTDEVAAYGGRVSYFQGGEVDWSAATGAHVIYGAIDGELNATIGTTDAFGTSVRTILGLPTSDEGATTGGRVVHFQGGDIDWSAATGAHAVYGAILGELNATAGETDLTGHSVRTILGLPISDEGATTGGRVVHFQGGDIDWSAATGAHAVYGAIRGTWVANGQELGLFGLPTVDEHAGAFGTRITSFQGGDILYIPGTGIRFAFNHQQIISALKKSEVDGTLDRVEFDFFQYIAEGSSVSVDAADRNLTRKLIDGDPANATYQSMAVGNLAPGSPSWKVDDLERKWFEGQDHPIATFQRANSDGTSSTVNGGTYSKATGPLFGPNGPVYTDVYQGNVGDCYMLATLAETAYRSPSTIRDMFSDNGDGTYTVRFYQNGAPTYVTVDNQLPSGGASFDHPNAGPIWAALAEKAYVQLNASGWLKSSVVGANSYAALDGGGQVSVALAAIAGKTSSYGGTDIGADWAAGKSVWLDTAANKNLSYLVPNHVYAVVGYNPTNKLYTLFNPWGVDGGYLNGSHKPGTIYEYQSSINSDFTGAERNTSSVSDGPASGHSAQGVAAATIPVPSESAAGVEAGRTHDPPSPTPGRWST